MLIYEATGFFEVENDAIEELYRSTRTVDLETGDGETFELQGLLCQHGSGKEQACHAVFFSRQVKRSLVFTVKGKTAKEQTQQGLEALDRLGLKMETVNLKLSPAMCEVVLRDIPGLQTPQQARKLRAEQSALQAELEKALRKDPEGEAGKRAKLKLNQERRLEDKAALLRDFLQREFAPKDDVNADIQVLTSQVEALTERLGKAEAEREEERARASMNEELLAAAEKRIQELEEVLVEVDTKSADVVKHKQKIIQLENQVEELTQAGQSARDEIERERDKQGQLVGDVRDAQARIAELEKDLAEATEVGAQLVDAEQEAGKARQRLAELADELDAARTRLEQEEDRSASLEEDLQKVRKELKLQEEKSAEADRQADDLVKTEAELRKLEKRLEKLTANLKEARAERDAERKEKQALEEQVELREQDFRERLEKAESRGNQAGEAEQRVAETEEELAAAKELAGDLHKEKAALEKELASTRQELQRLTDDLREAEAEPAVAAEKASASDEDRKQLEAARKELDAALEQLEVERSIRQRLESGAAGDQKTIRELENKLEQAAAGQDDGSKRLEQERLAAELQDLQEQVDREVEAREQLEADLDEAHGLIATLEKALKSTKATGQDRQEEADKKSAAGEESDFGTLTRRLQSLEDRLENDAQEKQALAEARTAAEEQVVKLQAQLQKTLETMPSAGATTSGGSKPADDQAMRSSKPLPHELRPSPKKGAAFHPDWDLAGLPCKSADQILQAWESVFNVQLSLEGYPSQYCTSFLVVLKEGKRKRMYLLFRLKKDKHTLVCVPAKEPKDEAGLQKMIEEGKKYLQLSGFELDRLAPENMAGALGPYFAGQ